MGSGRSSFTIAFSTGPDRFTFREETRDHERMRLPRALWRLRRERLADVRISSVKTGVRP